MGFETHHDLDGGLRFDAASVFEFMGRVQALFPSDALTAFAIELRYGRHVERIRSIEELLALPDLPNMLYDVKLSWWRHSMPSGPKFEQAIFLSRSMAVTLSVIGEDEIWVVGVAQKIKELLAAFTYRKRILEPENAPLSVVVYPFGIPELPNESEPTLKTAVPQPEKKHWLTDNALIRWAAMATVIGTAWAIISYFLTNFAHQ